MPDQDLNVPEWTAAHVRKTLPKRAPKAHKGTYGTALLIAGSAAMPGAALISGYGAMRSGLGKLEIATASEVIRAVVPALPEATYIPEGLSKIVSGELALQQYRAAAAGPGIVRDAATEEAVSRLLDEKRLPLILDAGALSERRYPERQAPVILTPHFGEFERITGIAKQKLRQAAAEQAMKWSAATGAVLVLKGPGTLIAFPDGELWRNPTGNPALAKGGTGDALTGMMLGMLCCHDDWKHAVLNAVYLHGACADRWTETRSEHALLARDLSDLLPEVWKDFS